MEARCSWRVGGRDRHRDGGGGCCTGGAAPRLRRGGPAHAATDGRETYEAAAPRVTRTTQRGYTCVDFLDPSLPSPFNVCLRTRQLRRDGLVMWTLDPGVQGAPVTVVGILPDGGRTTFQVNGGTVRTSGNGRAFLVAVPRSGPSTVVLTRADGSAHCWEIPYHSTRTPPTVRPGAFPRVGLPQK